MSKIKCLCVDDEPLALEIISDYINRIDYLEKVGECDDALKAIEFLNQEPVDLIFLDIQMPLLDGVKFIKTLKSPPHVIFTTAHRNYAAEGFELNAVDYLLKPIPFYRFIQAVEKARKLGSFREEIETSDEAIFFKVDKKKVKVLCNDILYIESLKDYIKVVAKDRSFVTYQSISGALELLPTSQFVQIHKSFIVNYHVITAVEGNRVEINDAKLPIGRSFKEGALDKIFGVAKKGWK